MIVILLRQNGRMCKKSTTLHCCFVRIYFCYQDRPDDWLSLLKQEADTQRNHTLVQHIEQNRGRQIYDQNVWHVQRDARSILFHHHPL